MSHVFEHMSACGNRFAVLDGLRSTLPADPTRVARELEDGIDGLLVVRPVRGGAAHAAMEVYNRDGTRPEACGNGLRCVAVVLARHGLGSEVRVATDAGVRELRVLRAAPDWRVRAGMGRARELRPGVELATSHGCLSVTVVDVGNPHAVLFVDDVVRAPVETLGPELERHATFPAGVNVEFAAPSGPARIDVRVWERGVGETAACGTGALACVLAAERARLVTLPCEVALPGGSLTVTRERRGEAFVEGPVEAAAHAAG